MESYPLFPYVGPESIRQSAATAPPGTPIHTLAEFLAWVKVADWHGPLLPATYTITPPGELRLAARHSEHVACAGGLPVLAAGELFTDGSEVVEITNQSTGYCPSAESWAALTQTLQCIGVEHPRSFTRLMEFRRCESCGEIQIVKDDVLECLFCSHPLPERYNLSPR